MNSLSNIPCVTSACPESVTGAYNATTTAAATFGQNLYQGLAAQVAFVSARALASYAYANSSVQSLGSGASAALVGLRASILSVDVASTLSPYTGPVLEAVTPFATVETALAVAVAAVVVVGVADCVFSSKKREPLKLWY